MDTTDPLVQRNLARVGSVVRRKYRLDALLGVGGTAAVFAATHRNGSRVALKVLHPELATFDDVRGRFLREGYVANLVGHPGVVAVLDDDDDDEQRTVFLVMALLSGETLEARAGRAGGRLPVAEVSAWADRVLDVLAAAHAKNIVHRDLKPENLYVTGEGELKVLDFGIARLLDGSSATRSGAVLGTPGFMPPEQAGGRIREVDARSDVWSVGAVLFRLLSGVDVHPARTDAEQLIFAATQNARPLRTVAAWVPAPLCAVVDKALSFDRAQRYASAVEMRGALRGFPAGPAGVAALGMAATIDDDFLTGRTRPG